MSPERFISRKLRFHGGIAAAAIAVSFLVIILAVAISSGFRHAIREGVATMTGDIRITANSAEAAPLPVRLPSEDAIRALPGVEKLTPVVIRQGIVRSGDRIHGVVVKGLPDRPDSALCVSIPARLGRIMGLGVGDEMTTYFVGEKVRVRRFRISAVHHDLLETDDNLVVYAHLDDLRRLSGLGEDEASALEVTLRGEMRTAGALEEIARRIGNILLTSGDPAEEDLVVRSSVSLYPQLFDWLDLLDFNVLFILVLMILVAGFNMVSGLLIVLLRNIATIGTLKTLGMTDRGIGKVFLRVASGVVLKGMLVGNALALLFCLVQGTTHLIPLDPANYFVSWVPVHVDLLWIVAADAVAYGAIMLLLLIPTLFIARVDPAKTVRAD